MARHLQQPVRRAVLISNGSLAAILTLSFNIGDVLFFTSQVAWALYSIIVVRIIDDVSPFAIVAWSGLLGRLPRQLVLLILAISNCPRCFHRWLLAHICSSFLPAADRHDLLEQSTGIVGPVRQPYL